MIGTYTYRYMHPYIEIQLTVENQMGVAVTRNITLGDTLHLQSNAITTEKDAELQE